MEHLDRLEKKSNISLGWIGLLILLLGFAVSIGTNLSTISELARRTTNLETRADSAMTKEDAAELKRRLERIEDKVDRISVRQTRDGK